MSPLDSAVANPQLHTRSFQLVNMLVNCKLKCEAENGPNSKIRTSAKKLVPARIPVRANFYSLSYESVLRPADQGWPAGVPSQCLIG